MDIKYSKQAVNMAKRLDITTVLLLHSATEEIPTMVDPVDILNDEDIADIKQARAEYARGEYYTHEEVWGKKE
jgi:KaiC/GvpD/RAD55 family RecA-like ATPase